MEVKLEALEDRLREIGGCTDGNCVVWRPTGMHTNGGCRCTMNNSKMQRVMRAYNQFRAALKDQANEP